MTFTQKDIYFVPYAGMGTRIHNKNLQQPISQFG